MTCESYDPPFIIKFDDFKDWKPCNILELFAQEFKIRHHLVCVQGH
jgi:hypothetical protein